VDGYDSMEEDLRLIDEGDWCAEMDETNKIATGTLQPQQYPPTQTVWEEVT
jgi:hypothetical protein